MSWVLPRTEIGNGNENSLSETATARRDLLHKYETDFDVVKRCEGDPMRLHCSVALCGT